MVASITACSSATSTDQALTSPVPSADSFSTAAWLAASLRPQTAMLAFDAAKASAMPRPMPRLPPVTKATLPLKSKGVYVIPDSSLTVYALSVRGVTIGKANRNYGFETSLAREMVGRANKSSRLILRDKKVMRFRFRSICMRNRLNISMPMTIIGVSA